MCPFYKCEVPAETVAAMAVVGTAVAQAVDLPIGFNVLRNDGHAQAGTRTFRVAAGSKLVIVEARGAGAPPKIVLSGPGRTIRTPDGPGALNTAQAMLAQDTSANTTYVALFSPPAGTWRVTGATSVRVADGLPPVRVSARVRRGVLEWSARGLVRGQRLQFVERARAGEANVLLTTRRARGRLKFTPDPALGTAAADRRDRDQRRHAARDGDRRALRVARAGAAGARTVDPAAVTHAHVAARPQRGRATSSPSRGPTAPRARAPRAGRGCACPATCGG